MLVLSRREKEKILFPEIGVSIELLQIKGNRARIGVDAPRDMTVLRGELAEKGERLAGAVEATTRNTARERDHAWRNLLNTAATALQLFRRQLEVGQVLEAEQTYRRVLDLLCNPPKSAASETDSPPDAPAARETPAPRQRTALLVEDDANEAELLAGYLRLCGYQVSTAGDGAHALSYLSENARPDVVLMDMIMPRLDGAATVREIRSNPDYEGIKIIAVSGTSPSAFGVETGTRGVDRWFQKPVAPETLVDHLSRELALGPEAA